MWGVAGLTPVTTHMCASTWTSGRSDPNPEQVFGQAFETLTGLGFYSSARCAEISIKFRVYSWLGELITASTVPCSTS
jgi:hypothetical protein